MAKKQNTNHVHKVKMKIYKSGYSIFYCVEGTCTYRIDATITLGKEVVCWVCGSNFLLTEYSMRLVKPRCNNCIKRKNVTITNNDKIDTDILSQLVTQQQGKVNSNDKILVTSAASASISDLRSRLLQSINKAAESSIEPDDDEPNGGDRDDDVL